MLINKIGTDEEYVVDLEAWKSESFTDPTGRETLSMAIEAAVASFAAGSPDASSVSRDVSPVSGITPVECDDPSSQVHAA